MIDTLTPSDALQLFRIIGTMDWKELDDNDHAYFADAGPNARIAMVNAVQQGQVCELLDFRAEIDGGLIAIIGGDHLQLEFHGIDHEGGSLGLMFPISITEV